NLLKFRHALAGWELVPIHGRSEAEVAALLRECLLFLSFGHPEGCPLPPLEAMACGCLVIGYHGRGGREYFHPDFCYPIETGDILGFARTVDTVLRDYAADHRPVQQKAARAAAYLREHYSLDQEERDIMHAWQAIVRLREARTAPPVAAPTAPVDA